MFIDDILRTDYFEDKSRDQLLEIVFLLKKETIALKSISQNNYNGLYQKINDLSNIISENNKQIETLKNNIDKNKIVYKKLVQPLSLKERITGRFDIKKINKE